MKSSADSLDSAWEQKLANTLRREVSRTSLPVERAVREARRTLGIKDVLGLVLGSLWLGLASLLAPLITRLHQLGAKASPHQKP